MPLEGLPREPGGQGFTQTGAKRLMTTNNGYCHPLDEFRRALMNACFMTHNAPIDSLQMRHEVVRPRSDECCLTHSNLCGRSQ